MKAKKKKGNVIKTEIVHMTCGEGLGALVTEIAREKAWNDCNYQSGIVFITDGLMGVSNDQAREVLDGKKKFVTNVKKQTLEMVKDDWSPPDFKTMRKECIKAIQFCTELEIEGETRPKRPLGGFWHNQLPEGDKHRLTTFAIGIKQMLNENIWKAHADAKIL
ncbi:MAG: hypothetical protein U9R75_06780, partial [Candidatus Thermoplasmatota archaeon]|nr:hypothetical protein [Candidatus Thermoplasmatota archaeon]